MQTINYLVEILLQNPFAIFGCWVLAFASIVGLSLWLRQRHGLDPATSLLATSLGSLNVLYWGAYVNFHLTQIALIAMGSLLLWIRRSWLERDKVAYLSLAVIVLWFAGMCVNTVPFSWDEFFWTLFDQHIANYSSYWDTQSGILISHIRYMPGAALWHNYFGIKGHYDEATAYFAVSVFYIFIFYWIAIQALAVNRWFLLAATVLALGCFSEGWFLLYVDPFVGLMMAIALITGIRFFQGDKRSFSLLIGALTGGVLFKETGVIPVLAIMVTLGLASLTRFRSEIEWKRWGWALAYCLAIILAWKYYQVSIGASNPVQMKLFTDTSPGSVQFRTGIWLEFFKYITSSFTMAAVWGLLFLILMRFKNMSANRISLAFLVSTVFGFIAIHLIAWLYFVGDGLAGSTRYMGSLLLALFIFYGVQLAEGSVLRFPAKMLLMALLIWPPINLLLIGIKPSALFMLLTPHPKQVPIARAKMKELKELIPLELLEICKKQPTKVWFVYQNSIGYEAMMARHIMTPCQVAPGSFSLGAPYFEGDIWTDEYSDVQFVEMATMYPYLVIANIDNNFTQKYQSLFTTPPHLKVVYKFDVDARKFSILNSQ